MMKYVRRARTTENILAFTVDIADDDDDDDDDVIVLRS